MAEMSPWLDLRRAAQGGQAGRGRGADPPPLHQDPPAGRRPRLLARRPDTSTSLATAATWCGACTTTTPTPTTLWYQALNDTPGPGWPADRAAAADIRQYFRDWLDKDGHPFWPFWENIAHAGGRIRDLPNVLLVHFSRLKADLEGEIRRIAAFLEPCSCFRGMEQLGRFSKTRFSDRGFCTRRGGSVCLNRLMRTVGPQAAVIGSAQRL